MLEIARSQKPVGQGGFHSAQITLRDRTFRYVYDCGSNQAHALRRELNRFAEEVGPGIVDLLVLSHLDRDHVNGVDKLLSVHDVATVLLPYLTPWERILLVARACDDGELTPTSQSMLFDPVAWFKERGVKRVVIALPSNPDGGDNSPPPPPLINPDWTDNVETRALTDWDGEFQIEGPRVPNETEREEYGDMLSPGADVLPQNAAAVLRAGVFLAWQLVPFVYPEDTRLAASMAAARAALGLKKAKQNEPTLMKKVKGALTNKAKRASLARAYRALHTDRNLTSMSLYSGPASSFTKITRVSNYSPHYLWHLHYPDTSAVGWLGTGDQVLKRAERIAAFEHFHANLLPACSTFMLPHHGSAHNFSYHLCAGLPSPVCWVIPYGPNSYGHPDRTLVSGLQTRGFVVKVNRQRRREFAEHIMITT